jgi:hypothetical protein
MSEGVMVSSTTYKYWFFAFFCNKFLKLPTGSTSYPLTTQSRTNPPLITQPNTLVSTQQTATILAVLGYFVAAPFPLAHPLMIYGSILLSTMLLTLSIICYLTFLSKYGPSSMYLGLILNSSLQMI